MTELTDEQINKRIHELMGLCWHEQANENINLCKCGVLLGDFKQFDFTTSWGDFGLLWTWLQKHERWEEFCEWYDIDGHPSLYTTISIVSPPALSRAAVEFFKEAHD